ncbi:hypothetical protein CONLIGDRAFT_138015 [Coniochaeta ligniaria NRRL 30616]|uniref:Ubiquitin 3 binding protein But2 C-terminal domain-containing protein n=1 Tax=Coniochaeta ligniaria NRRL 30616 TaxID=1408157 RepID=A0A1J7IRD4_9PEZI|nr:hypothetical protein CONLIGDRAFT_138015 [Coniochaeta ligniaria NRRL 30616]
MHYQPYQPRMEKILFTLLWSLSVSSVQQSEYVEQTPTTEELCCFHLEAHTTDAGMPGFILGLPAELQATGARHCLDIETSLLVDSEGRSSPLFQLSTWAEVQIYDTVYGRTQHGFAIEATDEENAYLVYDGRPDFVLQQGSAYGLHSSHGGGTMASEASIAVVRLFLRDQSTQCRTIRRKVKPEEVTRDIPRLAGREMKSRAVFTESMDASPDVVSSTLTCDVSASEQSLVPAALFVGPVNGTAYNPTPSFTADISSKLRTIFQFDVSDISPAPYSNRSSSRICGLQFRLPVCTQLPDGYPCYQFSGMEQEAVQRSGLRFSFAEGSAQLTSWSTQPLIQVWPGEDTIVGTFDCGELVRRTRGEKLVISWLAESVNGFVLHFLQAGVGRYKDGVGVFVVSCT